MALVQIPVTAGSCWLLLQTPAIAGSRLNRAELSAQTTLAVQTPRDTLFLYYVADKVFYRRRCCACVGAVHMNAPIWLGAPNGPCGGLPESLRSA